MAKVCRLLDRESIPNVYAVEEMSMDERLSLYTLEVLGRVRSSGVGGAFVNYIVINAEPVGWRAIWRSTPRSSGLGKEFDFLVEVQDVSQNKLEADVEVLNLLPPLLPNDHVEESILLSDPCPTVPLCELYPVFDENDEGLYDQTAIAIENVRFFYNNIWRPWDDDDDEDPVFVDKHLLHRLKLYYDMQSGLLPSACQIQEILLKAKSIAWKVEDLQLEMNCSDFDLELKEADVLQCMALNQELQDLHNKLQQLENPILSALILRQNQLKSTVMNRSSCDPPYYHLVAPKLTVKTLKENLEPLDEEFGVEIHKTLLAALVSSCDGDHILLLPGNYNWEGFGWLEVSLTIRGLGQSPEETVLSASLDEGDIFINSSAKNFVLENIQLVASPTLHCALMVHEGHTQLKSCHILGAETGISAICDAQLDVAQSNIRDCRGFGIECRFGSVVNIQDSTISRCQTAGLLLQIDNDNVSSSTKVHISSCQILENGFGVLVGNLDEKNVIVEPRKDDFFAQFLSRSDEILNCTLTKNRQGNVGQAVLCKMFDDDDPAFVIEADDPAFVIEAKTAVLTLE